MLSYRDIISLRYRVSANRIAHSQFDGITTGFDIRVNWILFNGRGSITEIPRIG